MGRKWGDGTGCEEHWQIFLRISQKWIIVIMELFDIIGKEIFYLIYQRPKHFPFWLVPGGGYWSGVVVQVVWLIKMEDCYWETLIFRCTNTGWGVWPVSRWQVCWDHVALMWDWWWPGQWTQVTPACVELDSGQRERDCCCCWCIYYLETVAGELSTRNPS